MKFLVGIILGFASHFGIYDVLQTLPFPDLASYACGVALVYPIAKARYDNGDTFESSFWLSFLPYGIGVLIARIVRGRMKKAV
jgi:hypothetical protein